MKFFHDAAGQSDILGSLQVDGQPVPHLEPRSAGGAFLRWDSSPSGATILVAAHRLG